MASLSLGAGVQSGLTDRLTGEVLSGLEATLQRLTADADHWLALLSQVYAVEAAGTQELFRERAEQIRQAITSGSFSLALELRTAEELQGGLAAYTAGEAGTGERILLNADWAATASDADLERVLLEELGHAFDSRLNPGADTPGDEGQLFAAQVLGDPLDAASLSAISLENDRGVLQLDGQSVMVEFAADPSYNAATYDTDGDGVVDANDLDDDNDGITDLEESVVRGAVSITPDNIIFSYAQNTSGFASQHDAAAVYLTGDKNDPAFFFDGDINTELRVHQNDVYEFGLPRTISAGSGFQVTEGQGSNDGDIAVLGSLGTTDPTGNTGNASGAGQGPEQQLGGDRRGGRAYAHQQQQVVEALQWVQEAGRDAAAGNAVGFSRLAGQHQGQGGGATQQGQVACREGGGHRGARSAPGDGAWRAASVLTEALAQGPDPSQLRDSAGVAEETLPAPDFPRFLPGVSLGNRTVHSAGDGPARPGLRSSARASPSCQSSQHRFHPAPGRPP